MNQVTVTSSKFDYNPATKMFFAEMSMFDHEKIDLLETLYPETGEKGFKMLSAKTNKQIDFVLELVDREADGDLRGWIFKPSVGDIFSNPELAKVKVMVVND